MDRITAFPKIHDMEIPRNLMTSENSHPRGFWPSPRRISRAWPGFLAILPACLLSIPAHATSSEWLNFPMYSRDTAHAVHLKALKLRPDGLLESASRYPGHNEEKWSAPENAQGQHEYERRLIDCQTGLHFTYETRLLAADGSVVASRATPRDDFDAWKAGIESRLREDLSLEAWPAGSEIFLACAAHADPTLLPRRAAEERRQNTATIRPEPLRKALAEDVSRLWQQVAFRPALKTFAKPPAKTARQIFTALQGRFAQWLKPFTFTAVPATTKAKTPPAAQAAFQLLAATPDGLVRYRQPDAAYYAYADVTPPLSRAALEKVAGLEVVHLAHCQLGLSHPEEIIWRDAAGKPLARQAPPVDGLLAQLRQRDSGDGEGFRINVNDPAASGSEVQAVCQAAARLCREETPAPADAAARLAAVSAADTPAAVLLAVRRIQQAARDRFIPNCQIGRF